MSWLMIEILSNFNGLEIFRYFIDMQLNFKNFYFRFIDMSSV